MPTPQEMVREFHLAFGLPAPEGLAWPTPKEIHLRSSLISEEELEVQQELDADVWGQGDTAALAKELADLAYVVYGTAVTYGIDLDAVIAEVHRSNMSKLDSNGRPIYNDAGKVLKGRSYSEADVQAVLDAQDEVADIRKAVREYHNG
jgi:predicted HAD superfamily Cof-like phosphohydrolase